MSLSYRKGDRTKRDDTAIAELKAGQDKIFELLQGLAGELRELKGSVGAVQTGFARSSWEQRDQETMKSVKAGKPWELGFGIAPAPTPSKEQRPSKDVVTSYTRLEDEKDGEDEKNGGATVVAGKRPPGAGIPQYADVAEMGRNFANDSSRSVLCLLDPSTHALASCSLALLSSSCWSISITIADVAPIPI